ncbi:MAG: hypothetical protein Q7S43_04695 [bacterium]|nr:hypothetical protein [bacterium]
MISGETIKMTDKIYYVTSDIDDSVLIAMNIIVDPFEKTVIWFDTVKERIMELEEVIDHNPDHLVFKRLSKSMSGIYTFIPMTLDIYNSKIRNKILIPRDFNNEEEMTAAFMETKNNAW